MDHQAVTAITLLIRHPWTRPPVEILSVFTVRADLVECVAMIHAALRKRIATHELN